jgi:hypothetical protein
MKKVQQLKELASTVLASIKNKEGVFVSDELWERKLAVCLKCPEMVETSNGIKCRVCGCNMHLKTRFSGAACPKGKW